MLLLLLLRLILLLLLRLMLLLRSLKCSTKLVHPAIAQATLSFLLLHGNDNLVFMAFYDGSIDPAEKYIQKKKQKPKKKCKTGKSAGKLLKLVFGLANARKACG